MALRFRLWFSLTAVLLACASIGAGAQKPPALPDVLQTAADYLVQYSQRLSVVAAEEEYAQYDTTSGQLRAPRRLSADFVLVGLGDGGVAGFRDVFAIDTAPVRPREDRLLALFKSPASSPLEQARQFSEDSVTHYQSPNLRALDQPMIALEFLRKENQERSTFKLESVKAVGGAQVAIVKFTERGMPRLVPTPGDGPAIGRFWIDVASGTVRQTELGITTKAISVRATVKYAADAALGLWLPVELSQQNEVSGPGSGGISNMGGGAGFSTRQVFEAQARYSKFRQLSSSGR